MPNFLLPTDFAITRQEILTRWPESESPPRADSLSRSLTRGCELGILVRTGEGTKAAPYRYALIERYRGLTLVGPNPTLPPRCQRRQKLLSVLTRAVTIGLGSLWIELSP